MDARQINFGLAQLLRWHTARQKDCAMRDAPMPVGAGRVDVCFARSRIRFWIEEVRHAPL
jgi:hypothetical protein